MISFRSSHKAFLQNLPTETIKKITLKLVLILFFGFIISSVLIVVGAHTLKLDLKKDLYILKVLQDLPFWVLTLIFFYRASLKKSLKELRPVKSFFSIKLFISILLLFLCINVLLGLLPGLMMSHEIRADYFKGLEAYIQKTSETGSILSLYYLKSIIIALIAYSAWAFSEEFVFRFTIYRFLRKINFFGAIVISSLLFALIHSLGGFISVFIFSVIISIYYEYTNNFISTVVLHACYNMFIIYYGYLIQFEIYKLLL